MKYPGICYENPRRVDIDKQLCHRKKTNSTYSKNKYMNLEIYKQNS